MRKFVQDMIAELRLDAGFSIALDQQLEAQEAAIYRIVYNDLKARQHFPSKTDVPVASDTFSYRIMDSFGRADWISDYSDEIPTADVEISKKYGRIFAAAGGYIISDHDLRVAAALGFPLETELGQAEFRALEEKFNTLSLIGVPKFGALGLFRRPEVQILAAGVDWDAGGTTGEQILADLRRAANAVAIQSKGKFLVNRIALPQSSYLAASSKPVNTAGNVFETALSVFSRTDGAGIEIVWDTLLETAGEASAKRGVFYLKSPAVAQIVPVLEPRIADPVREPLRWKRAIEARFGEPVLRQPLGCLYLDGL